MDRYWFLTWTTYGTWLPGDARGFTGQTKDNPRSQLLRDPMAPPNQPNQQLAAFSRNSLKSSPVHLTIRQAEELFEQFQETATHRNWRLLAVGIMASHIHLVVGVANDPEPEKILGGFKSYGSRRLSHEFGRPKSETWWTESGSKQKLRGEAEIEAAIDYIRRQSSPLLIWMIDGHESSKLVVNDRTQSTERRKFYVPQLTGPRLAGGVSPPVAANASLNPAETSSHQPEG